VEKLEVEDIIFILRYFAEITHGASRDAYLASRGGQSQPSCVIDKSKILFSTSYCLRRYTSSQTIISDIVTRNCNSAVLLKINFV